MDKKTKWGFALTITGLLLFCVAVFAVIGLYDEANSSTVDKVASIYGGMSGQIQKHFETLVDMRLVQIARLPEIRLEMVCRALRKTSLREWQSPLRTFV